MAATTHGPSHLRLALTVASIALLLLTACGEADDTGGRSDGVPPAAAAIAFKFDQAILDEDQKLIREEIALSRRFFVTELGRDLKRDITVEVLARGAGDFLGFSYGRTAWILTGGGAWPAGVYGQAAYVKKNLVAHELFHNFQWDLAYTDDALPSRSPWWILEGAAEYASAKYVTHVYNSRWGEILDAYADAAGGPLPRLDANALRSSQLYAKAVVAMDTLIGQRPLRVLGDYFEATGVMDWEDAFLQVFGEEPAAFVERFEAGRR